MVIGQAWGQLHEHDCDCDCNCSLTISIAIANDGQSYECDCDYISLNAIAIANAANRLGTFLNRHAHYTHPHISFIYKDSLLKITV